MLNEIHAVTDALLPFDYCAWCVRWSDHQLNATSGAQGWKKELLGGQLAVALLNMGPLPVPPPTPQPPPRACDAHEAVSVTVAGAGLAAVNGEYVKRNASSPACNEERPCTSDGEPVFELVSEGGVFGV
jgi:hypothetical protein